MKAFWCPTFEVGKLEPQAIYRTCEREIRLPSLNNHTTNFAVVSDRVAGVLFVWRCHLCDAG